MHRGILLEMPALRSPCGPFGRGICGNPAQPQQAASRLVPTIRWSVRTAIMAFPTQRDMT